MTIDWRPAHYGNAFDGYSSGRIVARVVRYADLDHNRGHELRGHFWQAFVNGPEAPTVPGRHTTSDEAMAAVSRTVGGF